jgi:glyoxylase-like metal-dependent hydrolase (beta-lactamase superfamily II)
MPFRRVCFLNSGYCLQWGYLAGGAARGWIRFHAVFVYLDHPEHGVSLIDTGYSPWFLEATRPFPQRLYRWATPPRLDPHQHAWGVLAARGLAPERVERIFVSHLHGDHTAGLRHFPSVHFVYRPAAHETLLRQSVWKQVRQAFLAKTLPDDFTARGVPLEEKAFVPGSGSLGEFGVHDYWGDGDLLLVDLPGHAAGHTGYVLRTASERFFYVVDACWDMDAMLQARPLPRLSRPVQLSYADYVVTQDKLRRLAARGEHHLLACHCPRTQAHVS